MKQPKATKATPTPIRIQSAKSMSILFFSHLRALARSIEDRAAGIDGYGRMGQIRSLHSG